MENTKKSFQGMRSNPVVSQDKGRAFVIGGKFTEIGKVDIVKDEGRKREIVEEEEDTEYRPPEKKLKISSNCPDNPYNHDTQYKLISWNINGVSAFSKKVVEKEDSEDDKKPITWAEQLVERENPTIISLQEIKLSNKKQIENFKNLFPGYDGKFNFSTTKKGFHGTAIFVKKGMEKILKSTRFGIGKKKHDGEGRTITCEFPEFYLVNNYVPNSGSELLRLDYRIDEWDVDLQKYIENLEKTKNVVWCGDLNCAILDIDVHNPKTQKSAGFHPRERKSLRNFLRKNNLVDTFRFFNKGKKNVYTYWGYRYNLRKKNKGWRIDYFVVSEDLKEKLVDSYILNEYYGSDHCPIGLILNK